MKDLPPIHLTQFYVEPGEIDWEMAFPYEYVTKQLPAMKARVEQQHRLLAEMFVATGQTPTPAIIASESLSSMCSSVSQLRRVHGLQKVQPVVNLLRDEFASGLEKIVIFAIHKDVIKGLQEELREFGVVVVYGGTPGEKRQKYIDRFQNDPKCRVFIGNVQAAGVGVTLTAAHHVLMVEADWVPGNNAQAIMRCHRIGQFKPVTVRFVTIAGSIDEKIQNVLNRKTRDIVSTWD